MCRESNWRRRSGWNHENLLMPLDNASILASWLDNFWLSTHSYPYQTVDHDFKLLLLSGSHKVSMSLMKTLLMVNVSAYQWLIVWCFLSSFFFLIYFHQMSGAKYTNLIILDRLFQFLVMLPFTESFLWGFKGSGLKFWNFREEKKIENSSYYFIS